MEAAGLRVHQRRTAAAVPVHPGLGLGGDGGRGAGLCGMGAHFDLQEVKKHAREDGVYPSAEIHGWHCAFDRRQAADVKVRPVFSVYLLRGRLT